MSGVGGKLQRIESGRLAALERAVLPAQGPHQDLKPPVLVEDDLGCALAGEHRDQKPDEDGLAGPRRTADERVSRVLARPAVGVGGVDSRGVRSETASARW